jgi:hypothetical protein
MRKLSILLSFLFSSIISFAGTIKGKITDATNGAPISDVTVKIKNTSHGVTTDTAGNYELNDIAEGNYELVFSLITYVEQTRNVTIKANSEATLDLKLKAEGSNLKGVTVRGTRASHTETAVILEMRKSSSIVSGISAAQIQKSMDRNAADVVKRVPGVTIQDDKFIIVRGLADRYNNVWLNDAGTPSSETDKKSFSFDMIPSGLIDRIMVYKTPAPELPGDFAGGMIKIYTTSLPAKNQISFNVQTSYRSNSTGTTFNYNQPSTTDWLGFDNGSRSIPAGVSSSKFLQSDPSNNATTKLFNNDWVIKNKTLGPDGRFNFSLANIYKLKKVKIGNTFGVTYSNTSTNYNIHRLDWDSAAKKVNYNDLQSETKVNVGLLDNAAIVFGNNKIEFKNLYNQTGKSSLVIRNNIPDADLNVVDERSYNMGYQSTATYMSQLSGTHSNQNEERKYTWTLGYTDLFKNQPDLRRIRYNNRFANDTVFRAQVQPGVDPNYGGGKYYAQLYEHTYSFTHQLGQKIHIDSTHSFELNVGNYIEYKNRSFSARELGYTLPPKAQYLAYQKSLINLPINEIFAAQNVGTDSGFRMEDGSNFYDFYKANNTLIASFISLKFALGSRINVSGGARYEYNNQSITGVSSVNTNDTATWKIKTKYLLPSINASYNFTEKSLLRIAYGKTLNRPEFREAGPTYFYDFEERAQNYGALLNGDTLKVSEIQNVDMRWEWYPSSGEMVHVGAFYKSFKNPISRLVSGGSDSKSFDYANVGSAYAMGLEVDVRKNLIFMDDWFRTRLFKNFAFVGNLSLIKSRLTIEKMKSDSTQLENSPLVGQSPYIINMGLFYQHDSLGLQGSLLYNVFGPRMYALGANSAGQESIGEMPFKSLDLVISKAFYKRFLINIGVQNLLDAKVLFVKDINRDGKFDKANDFEYKSYKPGRYFSIGLKVKI